MKRFLPALVLASVTLGLVAPSAEARRLGGGGNIGRQSSSPAMREAPRSAPAPAPTPSPAPARAPTPPASSSPPVAPQKPSFMSRWGGVIAGVGAGALLGSMLGGHLGGFGAGLGGVINLLLIVGLLYVVYRVFASRRRPVGAGSSMQFAGAGGPSFGGSSFLREPSMTGAGATPIRAEAVVSPSLVVPPGFEIEPFVRQARSAFLRLQAANDDRDLADLRSTTTPEVYAELAMQLHERGDAPQRTEVVTLDAQLLEVVVEDGMLIASLRYSGTLREAVGAAAEAFDEVWHLRRVATDPNAPWLIAGIQQRS